MLYLYIISIYISATKVGYEPQPFSEAMVHWIPMAALRPGRPCDPEFPGRQNLQVALPGRLGATRFPSQKHETLQNTESWLSN
jgi:hypothetical protein